MSGSATLDRCRTRGWAAGVATIVAVVLAVAGSTAIVGAHAESRPTEVARSAFFDLTIRSVAEREGRTNTAMEIVVPFGFDVRACRGPVDWTCTIDSAIHRPHTSVGFTAPGSGAPPDVDFVVSLTSPDQDAIFLFPTMQTNDDGFVEPWVYVDEPYPAPRVRVGEGGAVAYAPGSTHAPCIGPVEQPSSYRTHDGSDGDRSPCPKDPPPTVTSTSTTTTTTTPTSTTASAPTSTTTPTPRTTSPVMTTATPGSEPDPTTAEPTTTAPGSPPPTSALTASTTTASAAGVSETDSAEATSTTAGDRADADLRNDEAAGASAGTVDEGDAETNLLVVFTVWAVIGAAVAGAAVAFGRGRSK